jgi:hypothetical protein
MLVIAVAVGVYFLLLSENARRSSQPSEVAGWDELEECGSLTSFDGTKTLDFDERHKATLTEKSSDEDEKPERKTGGTWFFNKEKERYTVRFKDAAVDYELAKPEDSSVCILAPGDADEAKLSESWFGQIEEEE